MRYSSEDLIALKTAAERHKSINERFLADDIDEDKTSFILAIADAERMISECERQLSEIN